MTENSSTLQLGHGIDKLPDGFDLRLHVHGDDDLKLIFDRGDEVHDRQAVPFQITGKGGRFGQVYALLVERLDLRRDAFENVLAVAHALVCPFVLARLLANRCVPLASE